MSVSALIVDESDSARDVLRSYIEGIGCHVVAEAENALQALNLFRTVKPDLVALDLMMAPDGELDATALFAIMRKEDPIAQILLTGPTPPSGPAEQMLAEGALAYLMKPISSDRFEAVWAKLAAAFADLKPRWARMPHHMAELREQASSRR